MNTLYFIGIIAIVNLCYKTDRWLELMACCGENDCTNNRDVIRPRCSSAYVIVAVMTSQVALSLTS